MMRVSAISALFAFLLAACTPAPTQTHAAPEHPDARVYEADRAATSDVDAALARAQERGTRVLLVLGANWCHDSRGLAGWFSTPRFARMIHARYELVYVDVGNPQEGKGRNIELAQRFALEDITGTPTVLILSAEGELLNAETAPSWRNAASRSEEEIYEYFDSFD